MLELYNDIGIDSSNNDVSLHVDWKIDDKNFYMNKN